MTDEEKLAEEYVKSVIDVNAFDWKIVREISLAYLAGLKTGKEIEREYVRNNAFTSMKEQGLFPFGKWHKVADGDLPSEEGGWVCNQNGLPCYYDWGTEQWLDCEGTQIRTTEWCHMPHKE